MAIKTLSSDVYDIHNFINTIKQNYTEGVSEDTLMLGIYGYLGEIFASSIQNSIVMASEFCNESIPTKAKYERNIMSHALGLGISNINVIPAYMEVLITFVENDLINQMTSNTFIFDKNNAIYFGEYEYHPDYDIRINRIKLASGDYTYTAKYIIDIENPLSDITNPYITPPIRMNMNGTSVIFTKILLRQIEVSTKYNKILSDNSISSKTFTFDFDSQLAAFTIDVTEGDVLTHMIPVYEGLTVANSKYPYFYYSYIDANTIRCKFDSVNSYQPRINSDVVINIQTSHGEDGNFKWSGDYPQFIFSSTKYEYSNLACEIRPITGESLYGSNKKSIEEIKRIIPKEALSRNSISNLSDLNNYFNMMDTESSQVYLYKKRDNCLERLYFIYLLLKNESNIIIPTNTLDIRVNPDQFITEPDSVKMTIKKGNIIRYVKGSEATIYTDSIDKKVRYMTVNESGAEPIWTVLEEVRIRSSPLKLIETYGFIYKDAVITELERYTDANNDIWVRYEKGWVCAYGDIEEGITGEEFLYVIPYDITVNKDPLYTLYRSSAMNINKMLNFSYINEDAVYQFISTKVNWSRAYTNDKGIYTLTFNTEENILDDNSMVITDPITGAITGYNVDAYIVLYDKVSGDPLRWSKGAVTSYNQDTNIFTLSFTFKTNDIIDTENRIRIEGDTIYDIGHTNNSYAYFSCNTKAIIHIVSKQGSTYGLNGLSKLIPNIPDTYSLSNSYEINGGLDFFYNFSEIVNSTIAVVKETDNNGNILDSYHYLLKGVPMLKYDYFVDEYTANEFFKELVNRKNYIDYALNMLEDNFGIDFKFFNTYGPSKLFSIDGSTNPNTIINRINLSLTFRLRLRTSYDENIVGFITQDIKDYVEDINEINDLHIPNLVTTITNKYSDEIIFFEFVDMNGYGPGVQHLYNLQIQGTENPIVPEFININTLEQKDINTGLMTYTPDITILIV